MRRLLSFFLAFAAACGGATPSGGTTTTNVTTADAPVTNPTLTGTWRWGLGTGARAEGTMTLVDEDGIVRGLMSVEATHESASIDGHAAGGRVALVRHARTGDESLQATIDANGLSGALASQPFWALRISDDASLDGGPTPIVTPPPPTDAGAVIVTSLPGDAGVQEVGTVVPIPGEDGGAAPSRDAGRVVVQRVPPPPGCDCARVCYCGGPAPGPWLDEARRACAGYACPPCPFCPPLP